jgi:NAD+ diphosphatase
VANIREDKGYTYSPHAQVEHPPAGSRITLSADVSTPTTAAALLETVYELGRVATTPVSQAELDQARRYAIGVLALGTSSQAGLASTVSLLAGAGLDVGWLRDHPCSCGRSPSRTPSPLERATWPRTGSPPSWSATSPRSRRRSGPSWTSRWRDPDARGLSRSRSTATRAPATTPTRSRRPGAARVLVVEDGTAAVLEDDRPRLVLVPSDEAPEGDRLYLGTDDDGPRVRRRRSGAAPARRPPARPARGRRPARRPRRRAARPRRRAHQLARHPRRCPRCGTPTEVVRGGSVRRCPQDGSDHFPRTDPAVIMLVHDGADRCVLGRQASWPEGRFSTLAGFVEPGESAEQAVVREVDEEAGIAVTDVEYVTSQPWPFPSSLMLAFRARAEGGAVPFGRDRELAEVRWFTRDEVLASGRWGSASGLQTPPSISVAWHLITGWAEGDS